MTPTHMNTSHKQPSPRNRSSHQRAATQEAELPGTQRDMGGPSARPQSTCCSSNSAEESRSEATQFQERGPLIAPSQGPHSTEDHRASQAPQDPREQRQLQPQGPHTALNAGGWQQRGWDTHSNALPPARVWESAPLLSFPVVTASIAHCCAHRISGSLQLLLSVQYEACM